MAERQRISLSGTVIQETAERERLSLDGTVIQETKAAAGGVTIPIFEHHYRSMRA